MSADFGSAADSGVMPGSTSTTSSDPFLGSELPPGRSRSRLERFVSGLYRQTLVEPIEQGRLRDLEWPYGLRSIVLAGYVVFVIAGLMVIFSGLIREHSTLIVFGSSLDPNSENTQVAMALVFPPIDCEACSIRLMASSMSWLVLRIAA